jgi:hypothetical protein
LSVVPVVRKNPSKKNIRNPASKLSWILLRIADLSILAEKQWVFVVADTTFDSNFAHVLGLENANRLLARRVPHVWV